MVAASAHVQTRIRLGDQAIAFDELVDLARDKSPASRNRLVDSLGELYFEPASGVGDAERRIMAQILRQLVHDVEMAVRRRLADRMAAEPGAPPELVRLLANDAAEVAYPILKSSPLLDDPELIAIIEQRTMAHRRAIAERASLTEPVSDALVANGDEGVISILLRNPGAHLSAGVMDRLVEASREVEAFRAPLVGRSELTPRLARRMYWWVSAALRMHIAASFDLDAMDLDSKIVETVRELLGEDAARDLPAGGLDVLARKLDERGEITAKLLIDVLRQHQLTLFEALFARLVGLEKALVRRFVDESGGESLAIACKAAGLYKHDFTTIFLLSRSARPGEKLVDPGELSRAVEFYDKITRETARKVVERWQYDPDYLEALKKLKASQGAAG